MATLKIKDSDGTIKYLSVSGSGTVGDPYKPNQNMILNDADGNIASVDEDSKGLVIIEALHREIHKGNAYRFGGHSDVSIGSTYLYVLTTPATPNEVHLRPMIDCELEALIELFEDIDTVVGGTAVTPRNANRNSADASGITVLDKVTSFGTASAIKLGNMVVGSGKNLGGSAQSDDEYILKPSTTYGVKVTNQATAANNVNIRNLCYITS